MDWYGNRYFETYTYTRVTWDGWNEYENYGYITDGSLEYSTSSSLKSTGSFSFEGLEVPRTDDLVRVYYSFRDSYGEETRVALGTFFVKYSALNYTDTLTGMKASGTLNAESVLVVLEEDMYGPPLTITRGSNPILEAVKLIKECGLNVDYEPTGKALGVDYTFQAGTSYLEMVNWLCDTAGYYQAYPDAYGTVILKPISVDSTAELTFANDDQSIMYPEVGDESNLSEAHNVVKIGYSSAGMYLQATAQNLSGSPISLDKTGGRRSVLYEEASDIEEGTNPTNVLRQLAEDTLKDESLKVETVTFSHAYVPMELNQSIQVDYSDFSWMGYLNSFSVTLKPSTKTQTKIQKEEYYDITFVVEVKSSEGVIDG